MKSGPLRHFVGLRLVALLLPAALGACASLGGAPTPVIGVGQSVNLAQRYSIDDALRAFHDDPTKSEVTGEDADLRRGLNPQQYRDMVVSVHLSAIDARYFEFKNALSDERRELSTGFDFAILSLTTAASVARASIVSSLSAAASVMTGTRSSIDRNLYFSETLPGLFAAMDAARLRVRADITRKLNGNANEYPLEMAFADLRAYQMSASLNDAIGEITAQAAQDRRQAQNELDRAVRACTADANAVEVADRLSRRIYSWADPDANGVVPPANVLKLRLAATALDIPARGSSEDLLDAILVRIQTGREGRCARADIEDMIQRIETLIGEDI